MTPEQTLDWLAQQHFDQCCEERPIQDWIRKMKSQLPEQPKQNTVEAVKAVLKGIDQTEIESPEDGWWETSAGAEFGEKKLKYVIGLLAQPEQEPDVYIPSDALRQLKGTSLLILRSVPLYGYHGDGLIPLYTAPPQRTWVGLTDDEIKTLWRSSEHMTVNQVCRAIEAKLKEKNA